MKVYSIIFSLLGLFLIILAIVVPAYHQLILVVFVWAMAVVCWIGKDSSAKTERRSK